MHRKSDGPQELLFHYCEVEDLVLDLFADPMAKGKQHLYFRRDIGANRKRLFTDARTCLALEHAAIQIGDSDVQYFPGVVHRLNKSMELCGVVPCVPCNSKQ